jgi:arginine/ornithine N-succinyltransferase beta subunit
MPRSEQYEVWLQHGGRWEFLASFLDFEIAKAMAGKRSSRVRLLLVTYEGNKKVGEEVLAEIGAVRRDEAAS